MTGTQGSRSHEETEGTQYVCGIQCGPGNQLLWPECLFLPEARVHGHSMGTKYLCQRVFWEIIQTGDLTLDGDFPCVHSPVPLLGVQGDPAEVPGKEPKGRSGLLPSALWPHGGAAALRVCTARGSTALSGVRPRWLTCRLGVVGGGGAF